MPSATTSGDLDAAPAEVRISNLAHLREIVADLVKYRGLLYQLTLRDIKIRYKQAVMGFGWAVFLPAIIVLAGLVVRFAMGVLTGKGIDSHEVAGMAVKAVPWAFFMGAISFAVGSLTGNMTLVSKVYFPREVMPLSAVMAQGWDSTIGAVSIGLVLPFLGVVPRLESLWVFPLAVLLVLLTAATALFLSCANLFFRDVKYIVQVLLTFGIFFTPVFFEPQMFGETGARLMMLNPVAPLLEGLRLAIVEGHNLWMPVYTLVNDVSVTVWTPWYLGYSMVWAVGGLFGAALMFHRLEFLFAEYV